MMSSPFLAQPKKRAPGDAVGAGCVAARALLHSALHGLAVWLQILLASAAALLCEANPCCARAVLPARRFVLDGSALLTGALIGLTFPPLGPWWLVVVGAFLPLWWPSSCTGAGQ